ncbi:hypothetical protein JZ751_027584 [Albula glossodonta]|uniref:SERTA domain-containing protein n=1 Tax=Albula glossodonta TaxID=121402 RepID=A0A8T2NBE7_9TELE|nr:hypothetical protein JZ751_027584 [Albula glossodonta]
MSAALYISTALHPVLQLSLLGLLCGTTEGKSSTWEREHNTVTQCNGMAAPKKRCAPSRLQGPTPMATAQSSFGSPVIVMELGFNSRVQPRACSCDTAVLSQWVKRSRPRHPRVGCVTHESGDLTFDDFKTAEYMLAKGEKRKLDEDEDGLEGKALATAEAVAGDGPSKVSYTLQRQTIFNISLMKLYNQRALTEPSLERRVLINNMLRRIQEELKQEGGPRPLFFPASPPPDDPVDEGFREAQPAFGGVPPLAPPPPPPSSAPPVDSCLTPASLLEDDTSLFCTSPSPLHPHLPPLPHQNGPPRLAPPPPSAKDSFSSALEEIEELCPSASVTATIATTTTTTSSSSSSSPGAAHAHLPPSLTPAGQGSKDCGRTCSQKLEGPTIPQPAEGARVAIVTAEPTRLTDDPTAPPGGLDISTPSSSSSSSSSSGFLTDLALDDILFADIDTSMYDFDPCTSTSGGQGPGPSKMAPVVTADDLVKTLSPYSGGGQSVAPPSQPFKMDLAELDHIMEVLVGS